jgi:hypothetical protein
MKRKYYFFNRSSRYPKNISEEKNFCKKFLKNVIQRRDLDSDPSGPAVRKNTVLDPDLH